MSGLIDLCGSLGKHQAMAPAALCFQNGGQDLFVASIVFGERAMDARDGARNGQVDLPLYAEPRG